jgi:hypothetical protein
MVALPLLYPEVFQQFGITPPRGVLFHGPPGTGTSLQLSPSITLYFLRVLSYPGVFPVFGGRISPYTSLDLPFLLIIAFVLMVFEENIADG